MFIIIYLSKFYNILRWLYLNMSCLWWLHCNLVRFEGILWGAKKCYQYMQLLTLYKTCKPKTKQHTCISILILLHLPSKFQSILWSRGLHTCHMVQVHLSSGPARPLGMFRCYSLRITSHLFHRCSQRFGDEVSYAILMIIRRAKSISKQN